MQKIRRSFLYDILHYQMSDSIKVMMANEYLEKHGNDLRVYVNNDCGLEDMLADTEKSEIARAICYGKYSYVDPFVKFNIYGNIESFDDVWSCDGVDTDKMIEWLVSGNETDLADAYMIMAEDDIADVVNMFVECFADEFDFEHHIVSNWVYYNDIEVKHICREDWDDLLDNFKQWKENRDWQERKADENCGL